uniref:Integrase catalytic domain-containing protein n=1 Tax=Tanacetum cinerariifolium TaxID=118510 RepID=A0A699GM21_TANCI|nr:hypothetical protein [Tanacetum cinerariifolium]
MTTSVGNNSVFRSFFKKQKLTGPNFIDWYRQQRLATLVKWQKEVVVLMLLTMDLEIQQNLAHLGAYDMLQDLKALYSKQVEHELLHTNYNMHSMGKTMNELHAMLKLHEDTLPKKDSNPVLHANEQEGFRKTRKINCIKLLRGVMGLRGSKKLKPGALSLYVGDGYRAVVKAIGTYHLELPSGLAIVLKNCHYAPSITRGVVSVSCLFDDGFINRFDENNVILVSKNNLVYFMPVPRDGIFEIDMSCSNTNDSSMYAISNKRAKINLDTSLLWHFRLGHISKKRIEKLQDNGLLNSIDIESLGKIVSRQGANYFVTFTDEFSLYGYVYLLKHKHEVFETFKVFQKEVENQLGKTIKSPRSDRRGEYTSQEFLDHLKEHEIIAYNTPPNTPQHNGVSEKRNRTLLDMVRSMMSQTTLPKSFWDYALETTTRILNMVPTKKSSKTLRVLDRMCLYIDAEEHESGDLGKPDNYKATLLDPESKKWLDAMNVEMESMKDNDTDMDGTLYVFKAHLVANGFTQTYGVDYEETFSPVVDIRAIRILIAIVTYYNYEIWQMDVKTTFLNGHLFEEVYMEQPKGFVNPKSFAKKDLGDTAYILGIKIYRDRSKRLIGLCLSAYIEKILKSYYMENSKRETIPMQEKIKLSKSEGASTPAEKQEMKIIPYVLAIGSIMYAVSYTRPDVAFA